MKRLGAAVIVCLALAGSPLPGAVINGIEIPDAVTVADGATRLVLNGAGIREKFFLDIYIGALYLERPVHEAAAILAASGAASILMRFTYRKVGRDKIIEGWNDGLAANLPPERMQSIRPRLEEFNSLFRDVLEGDVIRIDYLPGQGTQVRINEELRGTVEGNDFFRDLLRVWLGPEPVSKPLKRAMLGLD